MTRSVLISGGGIAGPSLAYWLGRAGYAVTVVERAPGIRGSGAAPVDFRGDQLALLERMGVLDDIQASQTGMGDQTVIDAEGGGDFAAAFRRYELIMRPAVAKSQKNAAGAARFLTPATERKIRSRNRTFRILSSRPMTGLFGWLAKRTANTGKLREYPLPYPARSPAAASK